MKEEKALNTDSNHIVRQFEDNNDKKRLNLLANSISTTAITIYILVLSLIEYMVKGEISYNLFSIFFIGELAKCFYKYVKSKNNLYLLEVIGCTIALVGLFILISN